jgi:hypothetical protein
VRVGGLLPAPRLFLLLLLFSGVRGIGILRTSPFGHSAKFAYTAFSEVRKKVVKNTAIE